ncbi:hypothetical protein F0365_01165 [Nonlabens sp. Ci31]|jgi:hypothetical protein|uniref:hypothetical protein n=1 Tax=Nonlabens sp. Ci31 TaxID=2608253 RepID=UPI001462B81C|nr:hypothetical protein [Nonlabens sp. Ci31]QJP33118.1 hypothetical protein F0365_01165 [Nonlabens sp. Ci31]
MKNLLKYLSLALIFIALSSCYGDDENQKITNEGTITGKWQAYQRSNPIDANNFNITRWENLDPANSLLYILDLQEDFSFTNSGYMFRECPGVNGDYTIVEDIITRTYDPCDMDNPPPSGNPFTNIERNYFSFLNGDLLLRPVYAGDQYSYVRFRRVDSE